MYRVRAECCRTESFRVLGRIFRCKIWRSFGCRRHSACWPSPSSGPGIFRRLFQPIAFSENLGKPEITILATAPPNTRKGHIPGSISAPLSLWAPASNGLSLELPSDAALKGFWGTRGIRGSCLEHPRHCQQVETDFGRADTARVAWTCMVAGLKKVAVLNGGYNKWRSEGRISINRNAIPESSNLQDYQTNPGLHRKRMFQAGWQIHYRGC